MAFILYSPPVFGKARLTAKSMNAATVACGYDKGVLAVRNSSAQSEDSIRTPPP
jgi:hypothetical protein